MHTNGECQNVIVLGFQVYLISTQEFAEQTWIKYMNQNINSLYFRHFQSEVELFVALQATS